jgi:hypothetical protein
MGMNCSGDHSCNFLKSVWGFTSICLEDEECPDGVLIHMPPHCGGEGGCLHVLLMRHNITMEDKVVLNYLDQELMPPDIWILRNDFKCLTEPYL